MLPLNSPLMLDTIMGKGRGWHGEAERHSRAAKKGKESIPESHVALGRVEIKHPEVHVRLVGEDGNAFAILGRVRVAMRDGGVGNEDIEAFTKEATSGDYDHLLATVMRWVTAD